MQQQRRSRISFHHRLTTDCSLSRCIGQVAPSPVDRLEPMSLHKGRSRRALWLCLILAALACSPDRSRELLILVPSLSPDIAAHLVNDDPAKFERFARRTSRTDLLRALTHLTVAPPTTSMQ